jgi:hypothetical protein
MAITLRSANSPEKLAAVAVNDRVEIWHGNWARHTWADVLDIEFHERTRHDGTTYLEGASVTVVFRSHENPGGWRVVTLPVRAYSDDIKQCYTPDVPMYSETEREVLLAGLAGRDYAEPNVLVASLT